MVLQTSKDVYQDVNGYNLYPLSRNQFRTALAAYYEDFRRCLNCARGERYCKLTLDTSSIKGIEIPTTNIVCNNCGLRVFRLKAVGDRAAVYLHKNFRTITFDIPPVEPVDPEFEPEEESESEDLSQDY